MNKGYTLIEIIVVVAILAIVTSLGLAYYNQFTQEKNLETEVSRFVSVLNLARQKALAGVEETNLCSGFSNPVFGGYRMRFADSFPGPPYDNDEYWLRVCCNNPCDGTKIADVSHYTLPDSITLIWDLPNATFIPLYGTLQDNTDREIVIKNSAISPNKCFQVTISAAGLIGSSQLSSCP